MRITFNCDPTPKQRPRLTKSGIAFTPKKTRIAEAAIKYELRQKWNHDALDGPVSVTLDFYIQKPKSVPKKRVLPIVKPDLDNLIKLVLDGCNRIVFRDDSLICKLIARKHYVDKDTPGCIEMSVSPMEETY